MHIFSIVVFALLVSGTVSAKLSYFHNDYLGSPVAMTDEAGQVLWKAAYYPWGERDQTPGDYQAALDNKRWYTGHVQDDSGLVYMQARYYDPVTGRFISMDPMPVKPDKPGTFNRYAYALNNPYAFVDPDGRDALLVSGNGSAVVGLGGKLSLGIYVTYPGQYDRDAAFDIGALGSASVASGVDLSLTANVATLRGDRHSLDGTTVSANVTVPLTGITGPAVDYETIVNVDTGEWAGQNVGVGISVLPAASVALTKSKVLFSMRDWLSGRKNQNTELDPSEQEALMWYGFIGGG